MYSSGEHYSFNLHPKASPILYQESEHLDDKETYEVTDNKEQVITGVIETIEDWIKNYAKEEVKLICHERKTYWHHELRTLSAFN